MKRLFPLFLLVLLAFPVRAKTPEAVTPVVAEFHIRSLMQFSMDVANIANAFDPNMGMMASAGISAALTKETGIADVDLKKPIRGFLVNPALVGKEDPEVAVVMHVTDMEAVKKAPLGAGQAMHVLDATRVLVGSEKAVGILKKEAGLLAAAEARKLTTDIEIIVRTHELLKNVREEINEVSRELNKAEIVKELESDQEFTNTGMDSHMVASAICNLGRSGLNAIHQCGDATIKLDLNKDAITFSGDLGAVAGSKLSRMIAALRVPKEKLENVSRFLPKGTMVSYSDTKIDPAKLGPVHDWMRLQIRALGEAEKTEKWVKLYNDCTAMVTRQQVAAQYDSDGNHQIMIYEAAKGQDPAKYLQTCKQLVVELKKPFKGFLEESGLNVDVREKAAVHREVTIASIDMKFDNVKVEDAEEFIKILKQTYGEGILMAPVKNYTVVASGPKAMDRIKGVIDRIIDNKSEVTFAKDRGPNAKRSADTLVYGEYSILGALRMQAKLLAGMAPPDQNPIEQIMAAIDMQMKGPEEPMRMYVTGNGERIGAEVRIPVKTVVGIVKGIQAMFMAGIQRMEELPPIDPDLDDF